MHTRPGVEPAIAAAQQQIAAVLNSISTYLSKHEITALPPFYGYKDSDDRDEHLRYAVLINSVNGVVVCYQQLRALIGNSQEKNHLQVTLSDLCSNPDLVTPDNIEYCMKQLHQMVIPSGRPSYKKIRDLWIKELDQACVFACSQLSYLDRYIFSLQERLSSNPDYENTTNSIALTLSKVGAALFDLLPSVAQGLDASDKSERLAGWHKCVKSLKLQETAIIDALSTNQTPNQHSENLSLEQQAQGILFSIRLFINTSSYALNGEHIQSADDKENLSSVIAAAKSPSL